MSGEFIGFFIIKLLKKPLLYFVMLQSTWEVGRNTQLRLVFPLHFFRAPARRFLRDL